LFEDAMKLRQAASTPERAPLIAGTFQRKGFDELLRESGEAFKKSGQLETAARCFAQIGERDEALTLLEGCARQRCSNLVSLNVEPDFDSLRGESRFQRLLHQLGR
jgi:hypothetical protein